MRLQYDATTGEFDIALTPSGGLDAGVGNGGILESAIWASLFSDGLADTADLTPDLGDDRRAWWGDSGRAVEDSLARSLLWLYRRAKKNEATRLAIQHTAEDAVQWLVDDGVLSSVAVTVAWLPDPLEGVRIKVRSFEPNGTQRDWQTDQLWSGIAS